MGVAKKIKVNLVKNPNVHIMADRKHLMWRDILLALLIPLRTTSISSANMKVSIVFEKGRVSNTTEGQALARSSTGTGTLSLFLTFEPRDQTLKSTMSSDRMAHQIRGTIRTSCPDRTSKSLSVTIEYSFNGIHTITVGETIERMAFCGWNSHGVLGGQPNQSSWPPWKNSSGWTYPGSKAPRTILITIKHMYKNQEDVFNFLSVKAPILSWKKLVGYFVNLLPLVCCCRCSSLWRQIAKIFGFVVELGSLAVTMAVWQTARINHGSCFDSRVCLHFTGLDSFLSGRLVSKRREKNPPPFADGSRIKAFTKIWQQQQPKGPKALRYQSKRNNWEDRSDRHSIGGLQNDLRKLLGTKKGTSRITFWGVIVCISFFFGSRDICWASVKSKERKTEQSTTRRR